MYFCERKVAQVENIVPKGNLDSWVSSNFQAGLTLEEVIRKGEGFGIEMGGQLTSTNRLYGTYERRHGSAGSIVAEHVQFEFAFDETGRLDSASAKTVFTGP
jgi:hypothetical protein